MSLSSERQRVYGMNRTQLEGRARDLGIEHPDRYLLPDLRLAILVRVGELPPETRGTRSRRFRP